MQLKFLSLTSSQLRHDGHDGHDINDDLKWSALLDNLGVKKPEQIINQSSVKQQLRENTEQAISSDVFSMPTIMAGTHLFWGFDATDMYLQYLEGLALLDCSKMQQLIDFLRPRDVPFLRDKQRCDVPFLGDKPWCEE